MAAPTRAAAAGAQYAFLGFYDANGNLTGGTTTAPANGSVNGNPFDNIIGIKTASPTIPDPDTVQVTGDDTLIAEFDFDSIATRRFTIDVAVMDLDQEAQILGTNVQTIGQMKLGMMDIANRSELSGCIILQSKAKKQDVGAKGQKAWSGVIIPQCTIVPLGRQAFTEREGAVYRFSVTPTKADLHPWGITILDSNAGTTAATYMPFTADYPIHIQTYRGDGTETDWVTQHQPISVAKTFVVSNKVAVTPSSVTPGTKTVVIAAQPGDAVINVVYEFDSFVEV